jgi:membrane-associated protein
VVNSLALSSSLGDLINPTHLLSSFGMIGVLAIIFAETGLLIGFFFPGDSLLFLAGVAASPFAAEIPGVGDAKLNIWVLLIGAPICAIAGAQTGHYLGARYGRKMFDRPNSRIFKPEYVTKAEHYFTKFGPAKAVVLARFIPIVRTFLNPVAGVLEMPAKQFLLWNAIGAVIWADGVLAAGYLLAKQVSKVPNVDKYLLPFVALIVLISCIPIFVEIIRSRGERRRRARTAAADAEAVALNTIEATRTARHSAE